ncbi:mucin-2 isoform X2 [Diachasmimorpha longicaudata]|uniref:mucin-2 isoform X2 n=1 Tax=Diachasmimorpha longicaudata TaxID=58733 RepID=UPI0030B87AEE
MNRRDQDPLLRQHCSRLLQLAETTNIKPGRGSGKRRGQKGHGITSSNAGGARITLQDIVRNDPGYTPNIEHLVFPERKGSNPNLSGKSGNSSVKGKTSNPTGSTAKSRLVEVIARPYMRGSSLQDSVNARNNHFNSTSLDSGSASVIGGHQPVSGSSRLSSQRRWLSQTSQQSSRQQSSDDGGSHVGVVGVSTGTTTSSSVQQPRRVSPASDSNEIVDSTANSVIRIDRERADRGNISILHMRGASSAESWESSKSCRPTRPTIYNRTTSIPNSKRQPSPKGSSTSIVNVPSTTPSRNHHCREGNHRRRDPSNSFFTGSSGTSGELFISGECSRELSPVRWCDREVDGVYLGRSGWVQVQQRSLDENRKTNYETGQATNNSTTSGTIPLSRRAVKLADYHCTNSEPGKCPDYGRSLTLDSTPRPDFLKLQNTDYEPPSGCASPHSIESFSPPSVTPIISPPPAFQDVAKKIRTRGTYPKAPFLPRSNAIIDSDVISPPSSPPPKNWGSQTRKVIGTAIKPRPRRQSQMSSGNHQKPVQDKQYRLLSAKSLEDHSTTRRIQFAQRYRESSSSSSSSMGFRSLDSFVSRNTMPRLAENTDSSVEGYEDGDEDDNPDSSLNLGVKSPSPLDSSPDAKASISQERLSRKSLRRSPGSSDAGKLSFDSTSSSSSPSTSSNSGTGRSPNNFKRSSQRGQHQGFRNTIGSPDSLQTSRVRRSKSLQLPEKRSPGAHQTPREHFNDARVVKITDKPSTTERSKRYPLAARKAQSTDEALNPEHLRETEVVTEYLYGTRSRASVRSIVSSHFDSRDDAQERREPYDVYFISSKQSRSHQDRRAKSLQRGATTPTTSNFMNDMNKIRCNTSTCNYWPHCSESLYSPNQPQPLMKISQSYPTHRRVSTDSVTSQSKDRASTCSSPASLDIVDDRDTRKTHVRKEMKSAMKRSSPNSYEGTTRWEYRNARASPEVMKNVGVSTNGTSSVTTSSSSSSDIWITTSDRTVTKSPKNPKSSGGSTPMEDTIVEGGKGGDPVRDKDHARPGSAPTKREISPEAPGSLEPHQRSSSLPKSFLTLESSADGETSLQTTNPTWHRNDGSRRSTPSPNTLHPDAPSSPRTAPGSPSPGHQSIPRNMERRRGTEISRTQRRIKASSTPTLLDHDESNQWSIDDGHQSHEETSRRRDMSTEHPLVEATIPLVRHPRLQDATGSSNSQSTETPSYRSRDNSQQESVLQKFRKSFSLRFHKRGSKEGSTEGDGQSITQLPPALPVDDEADTSALRGLNIEQERENDPPEYQQTQQKEEFGGDQKFRFGPLVWRSSKERKKHNKAARNAKCNSGDSGIQIEADLQQNRSTRHYNVRRTNSDLGGQRLLQWDTRGYGSALQYRRMLSTPSPIKTRPPRLSPRHSSHDIVTLRSNAKGRNSRTNLRRSLSQPLGINQLSPLMRTKTTGARFPGGNVLSEDEHDLRCGGSGGMGIGTSDDEMMSDSESSIASLTERKKSFEQAMDEEIAILAEAVWDHVAIEPEELAFRAGDLIDVLDTLDKDWWWGSSRGEHGWFPAAFVRLRVSQDETVEDRLAAMVSGSDSTQSRRRASISLLSNEQVRSSVVRELVQTERDFVKVLRDVAEGYVAECRRRVDMFTEEQIDTIFINIEDLLEFQSEFLKDLEARIDWSAPHKSCVAECFLIHRNGFRMYSEYCNSHPMAMVTLQELYRHNRYSKFFEACRLMRGLIEIPLDGYLLTPVQRICKYPLQLAELLKYTKTEHPDYHKIREALDAMRAVAVLINERKRRMESLEKLAAWQLRLEGWEGEDLIEVSSQLIYQGDAVRVTTGMWTNNITLFLFDHQLVYCKKDILKRDTYIYKGRIYLDTSEVIDVPDGKDHQLGVTVRHCLKVYSCVRDKWLLFCCRSAEEKRKWLAAMAEERRLVEQDRNEGLEFPAAARQLARLAATRQQRCRPPMKPRNKTYKHEAYEMPVFQSNTSNSLGRKVGTWFTFGNKKGTRMRPS